VSNNLRMRCVKTISSCKSSCPILSAATLIRIVSRYFGHGGGEQYLRTYKVRRLQSCAATMLWGCSSGALREMGDFDRTGTANGYMLAGW
jgi:hypothetical protein